MVRSQWAYPSNSPGPKKIFRLPTMWATRYPSMTRPVTAMIVFLPTVESQSVRVIDGRRSVRVANAMHTTVGAGTPISPRHGVADLHRRWLSAHVIVGVCTSSSSPISWPSPRPGTSPGPPRRCMCRSPRSPSRSGRWRRSWARTSSAGPGATSPSPTPARRCCAGPAHPRRRGDRTPGGPGGGLAAQRPGAAGGDTEPVHRAAADVLRAFHDRHPGVRLLLEEGGSHDLVRQLARARSIWPWWCYRCPPPPRADHGGAAAGGPGGGVGGDGAAAGAERLDPGRGSGGGSAGDVPARLQPAGADARRLPRGGLRALVHGRGRRDGRGARIRTGGARHRRGAEHGRGPGRPRPAQDPAGGRRAAAHDRAGAPQRRGPAAGRARTPAVAAGAPAGPG